MVWIEKEAEENQGILITTSKEYKMFWRRKGNFIEEVNRWDLLSRVMPQYKSKIYIPEEEYRQHRALAESTLLSCYYTP
jgi:hypothetical protein